MYLIAFFGLYVQTFPFKANMILLMLYLIHMKYLKKKDDISNLILSNYMVINFIFTR